MSTEIKDMIGEPAVLEQLAEECNELAHASLKLARILRAENPTPALEEDVRKSLVEEWCDVVVCGFECDIDLNVVQMIFKKMRWQERIEDDQRSRTKESN